MSIRVFLMICLLLAAVFTLSAQDDYPRYTDIYVNDFASILSPETEAELRQLFTETRAAGYQTVVVTMRSYQDYDTSDATFEEFATNLFNSWGVGDSDSDGVMILVATEDRKVRIEVGVSFENTLNDDLQGVINEFMLPRFRQGDYERGILEGSQAVYRKLLKLAPIPQRMQFEEVVPLSSSASTSPVNGLAVMAGAGGVAGGLFIAYRRYLRFKPRPCPKCGTIMTRLDEVQDDEFLDEGQRREEVLGSVDYDVWKCPSCATHSLYDYRGMSAYRDCPECHYRTMGTHSRVIDSASCYNSGLREVTHSCNHCSYQRTYEEVIPRRNCDDNNSSSSSSFRSSSSSSSSSSGSFGGGRSSGGGASGSW
jgi:uncharacterized protein